jgi:Prokaryotic E2 family E
MRREFQLPPEDLEYLQASGYAWEAVVANQVNWLIIYAYPIPAGYNVGTATIALRLPPAYPDEQIDMVHFNPPLALMSGRAIGALTIHTIDGKNFQQWSRHRTKANPWRMGLDNIGTHLLQVNSWLGRELQQRAA